MLVYLAVRSTQPTTPPLAAITVEIAGYMFAAVAGTAKWATPAVTMGAGTESQVSLPPTGWLQTLPAAKFEINPAATVGGPHVTAPPLLPLAPAPATPALL